MKNEKTITELKSLKDSLQSRKDKKSISRDNLEGQKGEEDHVREIKGYINGLDFGIYEIGKYIENLEDQ